MIWTPDRDAELELLYATGATYNAIARAMGITRNSVAGRAKRLNLTGGREVPFKAKPRQRKHIPVADILTRLQAPGPGTAFVDLRRGHCTWPLWSHNERPTHRVCGEKATSPESAWCPKHHRKAFRPLSTAREF